MEKWGASQGKSSRFFEGEEVVEVIGSRLIDQIIAGDARRRKETNEQTRKQTERLDLYQAWCILNESFIDERQSVSTIIKIDFLFIDNCAWIIGDLWSQEFKGKQR